MILWGIGVDTRASYWFKVVERVAGHNCVKNMDFLSPTSRDFAARQDARLPGDIGKATIMIASKCKQNIQESIKKMSEHF